MGGMAAFIPSRRDAEVNAVALAKVREDKEREASQGFDGTWVAHPDLVPVAMEAFDAVLGERPNQIDRQRDDVHGHRSRPARRRRNAGRDHGGRACATTSRSASSTSPPGSQGSGAVAINNLMEDAATAEISRSQIWQWLHHGRIARDDVEPDHRGGDGEARRRLRRRARALRERSRPATDYVEFLTLPAYDRLTATEARQEP